MYEEVPDDDEAPLASIMAWSEQGSTVTPPPTHRRASTSSDSSSSTGSKSSTKKKKHRAHTFEDTDEWEWKHAPLPRHADSLHGTKRRKKDLGPTLTEDFYASIGFIDPPSKSSDGLDDQVVDKKKPVAETPKTDDGAAPPPPSGEAEPKPTKKKTTKKKKRTIDEVEDEEFLNFHKARQNHEEEDDGQNKVRERYADAASAERSQSV